MGWYVAKIGSRYAALEPISMGLKYIYAATGAGEDARGLALRMDHGTQYLSDHFQNQVRYWGIKPSYDRIFRNIDDLRTAVARFVETYNQHWLVAKLGHRSPTQARHECALALAA